MPHGGRTGQRGRRRTAIGVLAALAVLVAGAPAAPAKVPAGWLGVGIGEDLPTRPKLLDGEFALMARSGVGTARVTFDWNVAQPFAGWEPWLGQTDAVVLAAARRGITVLPTVVGAPAWASDDPPDGTRVLTPRDPEQYAAWLRVLVARYGPAGTLWAEHPDVRRRPIRAWQVWNEPNLTRYWRGRWADGYVRLLRAAHGAIKDADPGAKVVLAGLPNYSWMALMALYQRGAGRYADVVALHPYTRRLDSLVALVEANRRVLRARGDARTEIWVTELGWPAATGRARDVGFNVTTAQQVRLLRGAVRELAANRKRLRIGRVLWYSWLSRGTGRTDPFAYSGLRFLTAAGGVRSTPALAAFRRAARDVGAPLAFVVRRIAHSATARASAGASQVPRRPSGRRPALAVGSVECPGKTLSPGMYGGSGDRVRAVAGGPQSPPVRVLRTCRACPRPRPRPPAGR